jgi:hypothetical protein
MPALRSWTCIGNEASDEYDYNDAESAELDEWLKLRARSQVS